MIRSGEAIAADGSTEYFGALCCSPWKAGKARSSEFRCGAARQGSARFGPVTVADGSTGGLCSLCCSLWRVVVAVWGTLRHGEGGLVWQGVFWQGAARQQLQTAARRAQALPAAIKRLRQGPTRCGMARQGKMRCGSVKGKGVLAPFSLCFYFVFSTKTMGKQSSLKKQRLVFKSPTDWANVYLNAKDARARDFRLQVAHECIDKMTCSWTITGAPIPTSYILQLLPASFVNAYINLVGHTMMGSRHRDFWAEIVRDLLIITDGSDNKRALKEWGTVENFAIFDRTMAKGACYAVLQQLAEKSQPIRIQGLKAEVLKNGSSNIFFDAIPTHLVISSCIEKQQIIHQSGSLFLCYAQDYKYGKDRELWLVKKRVDGIYTTAAEAKDGSLKVSDLRGMRDFVSNYQGITMKGTLCPGREKQAARMCKSIGLRVTGTQAWLENTARSGEPCNALTAPASAVLCP